MKNKNWLFKNKYDIYTTNSKLNKLRSRSWFKIYEINKKFKLFKKGINVIDIGSSPGGWSKYISNIIGNKNKIFACDIIDMKNINNVFFYKGDLTDKNFYKKFLNIIKNVNISAVVSDLSPNISGFSCIDIPKMLNLFNISLNICINSINKNGFFVLKLFNVCGINTFLDKIYYKFKNVNIFKPCSSKKNSREFYVISKNINE